MINPDVIMRVARPTDHLAEIVEMYQSGLGLQILAEFYDHQGFDGVVLGHPQRPFPNQPKPHPSFPGIDVSLQLQRVRPFRSCNC